MDTKVGERELREFLNLLNKKEPYHNDRYIRSFQWVEQFMDGLVSGHPSVLELGGNSPFTSLLTKFTDASKLFLHPPFDLRYGFPLLSDSLSLVICMEVIEHVKDQEDPKALADFTGSGIMNMLKESYRVLSPGGVLFLTTPNVCSYKNIYNLLRHDHPFFFDQHHRELSIKDVQKYIEGAGFKMMKLNTYTTWGYHGMPAQEVHAVQTFLQSRMVDTEQRGDIIFALAQKPM